jgi:hypothetical protein
MAGGEGATGYWKEVMKNVSGTMWLMQRGDEQFFGNQVVPDEVGQSFQWPSVFRTRGLVPTTETTLSLWRLISTAQPSPENYYWSSTAQSFLVLSTVVVDPWSNLYAFQDCLCVWKWGLRREDGFILRSRRHICFTVRAQEYTPHWCSVHARKDI